MAEPEEIGKLCVQEFNDDSLINAFDILLSVYQYDYARR
jgi:hypothetical protein